MDFHQPREVQAKGQHGRWSLRRSWRLMGRTQRSDLLRRPPWLVVRQAYLESQTKRRKGDIKSRSQGSAIRKKTLEDLTIVSLSVGVFLSFLIFVVQQQETSIFLFFEVWWGWSREIFRFDETNLGWKRSHDKEMILMEGRRATWITANVGGVCRYPALGKIGLHQIISRWYSIWLLLWNLNQLQGTLFERFNFINHRFLYLQHPSKWLFMVSFECSVSARSLQKQVA